MQDRPVSGGAEVLPRHVAGSSPVEGSGALRSPAAGGKRRTGCGESGASRAEDTESTAGKEGPPADAATAREREAEPE